MKIGVFYELQTPRPWDDGGENRVIHEALEQIELADQIGIDQVWAVEHHFLEEYSHCSAPEILLAAASQRTKNIRLGHGIVLAPPKVNHPARIAERVAMLDQVSNGRVDFGTGEGASDIELEAFGVSRATKHREWELALRAIAGMMADDIYPGTENEFFTFPRRAVVPKPYQKPHPPLWVACNRREKIVEAASFGLGALNFSFGVRPDLASKYVQAYNERFEQGFENPIGRVPTHGIAVVTGFMCAGDRADAEEGFRAMKYFMHAISYYFEPGRQMPERLDISGTFDEHGEILNVKHDDPASLGIFGTPDLVREQLRAYEETGVDQVILVAQAGALPHRKIMDSLRLFDREVLPQFKEREAVRAASLATA